MAQNVAAVPVPSASTIAATTSIGGHVLKVSGYSCAKLLLSTGNCIESNEFVAAGHSWRIKVYPNGYHKESASCISLFLVLASESSKDVHARFGFSFVQHGCKLTAKPQGGRSYGPVTFVSNIKTNSWGVDEVITREELEKPEFLKDDAILIRCDITVLNKPVVERQDWSVLKQSWLYFVGHVRMAT